MANLRRAFPLLGLLLLPVGCSASSSSDAASTTNAYSSEPTAMAPEDVPPFTSADTVDHYEGRLRVSVANAAPVDSKAMASVDSFHASTPMRFTTSSEALLPGTQSWVRFDFGQAGDLTVKPGTYSCASGDASVMVLSEVGPNSLTAATAATCTVTVDSVAPVDYSPGYVRVFGRFTAESSLPRGLPSSLRGAFVADTPLPIVEPPQAPLAPQP